jgi:hypothetical protein
LLFLLLLLQGRSFHFWACCIRFRQWSKVNDLLYWSWSLYNTHACWTYTYDNEFSNHTYNMHIHFKISWRPRIITYLALSHHFVLNGVPDCTMNKIC